MGDVLGFDCNQLGEKGVYQIELNRKRYVGSTACNFRKRWREHLLRLRKNKHENSKLQRAYNKHGEKTLKFSILEIVGIREEVIDVEQKYIDKLKPKYNILPNAGSCLGRNISEETRLKISNSEKGKYVKGHPHTKETRKRLSEAQKLNWKNQIYSEETIKKMGSLGEKNSFYGKHHSEETKKRLSEAQKLNWENQVYSEESIEKMREGGRNRPPHSEETKAKISKANKGKVVSVEVKEKIRQAVKEWWKNEHSRV